MTNSEEKIVLIRTHSQYWTFILMLMFPLYLVSNLVLFQYLQSEIFSWIITVQLLSLFLLLIVHIGIDINGSRLMKSTVNQQFPDNLDILNTIHDAFIIIHSASDFGAAGGLDILISKFKAENYPFKIYHCYNPDEFKSVIANGNAKYLWIFGHGWRGGISFKWRLSYRDWLNFTFRKSTNYPYCNLVKNGADSYPQKRFIAQMHCNNFFKKDPCNRSLPEFLMQGDLASGNYHVSDSKHTIFSVWVTTRELVKNVKRTPVSFDEDLKIPNTNSRDN